MWCRDCGTSWRDLGKAANKSETINAQLFQVQQNTGIDQLSAISGDILTRKTGDAVSEKRNSHGRRFGLAAMAGFVLLVCLMAGLFALGSLATDPVVAKGIHRGGLSISGVRLEETVRRSGVRIYKVHGVIENTTERGLATPRIAIALLAPGGKKLVHWYYSPPVSTVGGKRKLRFSSAVQHDTAFADNVEVTFE